MGLILPHCEERITENFSGLWPDTQGLERIRTNQKNRADELYTNRAKKRYVVKTVKKEERNEKPNTSCGKESPEFLSTHEDLSFVNLKKN